MYLQVDIRNLKIVKVMKQLTAYASEPSNRRSLYEIQTWRKVKLMETTKGKTILDEYEEDTSLFLTKEENTGEVLEEISGVPDDIFKEVGETVPEIIRKTKADGGRIGYATR
jgi:hypothetical protein